MINLVKERPIFIPKILLHNYKKIGISKDDAKFMNEVIKTHMGPWTTDYNGNEILEKPKTKYQNFVHMCDYLASRKCLLVPFDKNNKISV